MGIQSTVLGLFGTIAFTVIDSIVRVYCLFIPDRKQAIPPVEDPILLESATSLADKVRRGKVKSKHIVEAYLERIARVNPLINAVVQINPNAIAEAEEIDRKVTLCIRGEAPESDENFLQKPLLGIPFTVKNSISIKGMILSCGLKSKVNTYAEEDAAVVKNLREAGAIPIAVTNVPELLCLHLTRNKVNGRTNNPYDLSRNPGGSSGGEAALIASCGSLIGVGTDFGGSIRIPAAFCGIYGHKPTPCIVPDEGFYPPLTPSLRRINTVGPICRHLEDVIPAYKAMAGENIYRLTNLEKQVDLSKVTVYYMSSMNCPYSSKVQEPIKLALERAVDHLQKKCKVPCIEVNIPEFHDWKIWWEVAADAMAESPTTNLAEGKPSFSLKTEILKEIFGRSEFTSELLVSTAMLEYFYRKKATVGDAYKIKRKQVIQRYRKLLGDSGVLMYPPQPEVAMKHPACLHRVINCAYTDMFNVLKAPVTQCPLGLSKDGLPVGIQVAANSYNDHLTIAVAKELHAAFGGWVSP